MNETNALLSLISDWDVLKSEGCAHSIRENGRSVERLSTKNVEIRAKEDGSGLDIYVAAATKGEKVAIPACITAAHIDDLVYNDFHIAEGADVTIIAGCGIHVKNGEEARHSGIHRFFLARGSKVRYEEKHVGTGGKKDTRRVIDPVTEVFLDEDSFLEMDTSQIGGVDSTTRETRGHLARGARLVIREHLLTEGCHEVRRHTGWGRQRSRPGVALRRTWRVISGVPQHDHGKRPLHGTQRMRLDHHGAWPCERLPRPLCGTSGRVAHPRSCHRQDSRGADHEAQDLRT